MSQFKEMKKRKIAKFNHVLALKPIEQLSRGWLLALNNVLNLEQQSMKKKMKKTEKKIVETKRQQRISFGSVTLNNGNKTEIRFSTSPKEMESGPILEKFFGQQYGILHFLSTEYEVWDIYSIGNSNKSLMDQLAIHKISLETLTNNLKKIYKYFRKEQVAILGYRSSWKLLPLYKKTVYNPYKNIWEISGIKAPILPNLRMYLLKIVKDKKLAATIIETAWRQRRDKKILKIKKCVMDWGGIIL